MARILSSVIPGIEGFCTERRARSAEWLCGRRCFRSGRGSYRVDEHQTGRYCQNRGDKAQSLVKPKGHACSPFRTSVNGTARAKLPDRGNASMCGHARRASLRTGRRRREPELSTLVGYAGWR